MTFSGYNVEQRSKEVKALQSFLTYSFIGSMALHIGLLASGLGNFLARIPQVEEEPIEIAIVDPVTAEVEKAPEAVLAEPKIDNASGGGSQGGGGGSSSEISIATKPQVVNQVRPVPKVVDNFKTPQVQQQPQKTITSIEKAEPVNKLSQEIATEPQAPTKSAIVNPSTNQSSDNLRRLLSGLRNSQTVQGNVATGTGSSLASGSGSSTGNGIGSGIGRGIGSGTGNGVGSGTGNGSGTGTGSGTGNVQAIATTSTPPKIRTEPRENNRSGNGRAACRECNARYPEAARRRGIEGRVEVAVDTDSQGNVTGARIARSSGNRELDEETLRQARNWKLKPAEGGRQGVAIATEFALQGSRRHRQVQEQKKRREAEARSQQTTAANNDATEGTRRRRRLVTSTEANTPAPTSSETRVRRTSESTSERPSTPASATRTGTARESLRRIRRERTTNNSAQEAPQTPTPTRRQRRENAQSASQDKLRATLRGLRQPAQPAPAAPPASTTPANQE
ncbi:outer membrane transport energization protein TonB [Trichormus variabilis ATCC 29413]|uniref:Outer membrane transport energization protein TonB n=2 Tax=Anabaena variabilis TaxID=264691 RepID=Q3MAS3_TRIV2|nr:MULTISPECIES: energy transducer TonB [Nostocaceae]ABA21913.1 outer membrane transport energization protein TonB [Trichormus variabilis ATCC 29413]MBC1213390.1 energy transducer TonB [Trichormus variabilis ARAD]MBC1255096.1 energy transducer TonB [Trichormus variabilis V5]MBC1268842.1 energy transducer TonB [Trichormus variabilis FSR]MBC1302382.1 energy transducer TonB [Trichormus variabilis N2B]